MSFKRKIWLTISLMGLSLLIVWAAFYFFTARNLSDTAEKNMQRTAEQILDRMEVDFLKLEGMAFSIAGKPATMDFITEKDAAKYLLKSGEVDTLISDVVGPTVSVDHLLTFTSEGTYSRFIGFLGNTAATRLYHTFSKRSLPSYFGITLEGTEYICYAVDISDGDETAGMISLLMRADELLNVKLEGSDYHVSLSSNGQIIASSDENLMGISADELISGAELYQRREVGFAPFEIIVTAEKGYLSSAYIEFIVVEIIIAVVFIIILIFFVSLSNKHLFRPILKVIHGVEGVTSPGAPARLEKTGEDSFDMLVEQVNNMLDRMETLQGIELERQKSLIISLKKQIDTHFTVNVLNVINQLARQGELEKASTMTAGLSSLLQYVNAEDESINAVDELQILSKYVTMMQIRYQNEFEVDYNWDEGLMDIRIQRMLIQPIIENAIIHGLDLQGTGGKLWIGGYVDGENVVFTVEDNGRGMSEETLAGLRQQLETVVIDGWTASGASGIALANIQRRVRSYYGDEYGLEIFSEEGKGTTVKLTLPSDGTGAGAYV